MSFFNSIYGIFDIIIFALTSNRARQIVKILKIPLNEIRVLLSDRNGIALDRLLCKIWNFWDGGESKLLFDQHLLLQKNAVPLYTRRTDRSLESYTKKNDVTALKMAMEFLNEVFKCTVETVNTDVMNFPESGDIGFKSTVKLIIDETYGSAQNQKLGLLLKNLEVTDACIFWVKTTENGFYCDPKLFKCRKLVFWMDSGAWVTREILLQFEVPRLIFDHCRFSVEDIVSFVANWFYSDNKKFESLYIGYQNKHISLEQFKDLKPLPFTESKRVPRAETYRYIDFSVGLDIVRHDDLVATIYANNGVFLFYVWHDQ